MKILTQKRDEIIELPKKIWATTSGTKGVVVTSRATLDQRLENTRILSEQKKYWQKYCRNTRQENLFISCRRSNHWIMKRN